MTDTGDAPPLPGLRRRTTDAVSMAGRLAVAIAVSFLAGCLELEATGLPGTPSSFGVSNECYAEITCRGVYQRWEFTTCALAGSDAAEEAGDVCDQWAWANCPEATYEAKPCHVHCDALVKSCPVYEGETEWPPRDSGKR